jgi:hypothetical protein
MDVGVLSVVQGPLTAAQSTASQGFPKGLC